MTHALKCHPEYYTLLKYGNKNFELRKDDRPFLTGDEVIIQEYDPVKEIYTGNELKFYISYILRDCQKFGLKPGYCILALKEIQPPAEPPKENF